MSSQQHSEDGVSPVILVIDDEDYVADMIASGLALEGYTTHVAYNGRDGLALAKSVPCHLIVIDIMMPYISGIKLIEQIRALPNHQDLPVVLISAGARPARQMPGVVFIAKPFDMMRLASTVRSLLSARGVQP